MLTPQYLCNAILESTNGETQLSKESRAATLQILFQKTVTEHSLWIYNEY